MTDEELGEAEETYRLWCARKLEDMDMCDAFEAVIAEVKRLKAELADMIDNERTKENL